MKIDYSMPYTSQRSPVFAGNMVSTSHPLAAQAGLEMLRLGGTAADAAVATAMALTVLEPTANGIGGDAFALVWSGGGLHGLNASGRAAMGLKRERYDGLETVPTMGWLGVTTPGAVSGWVALAAEFGRLPLTTIAGPAIRYAREGAVVPPEIGYYWDRAVRAYGRADAQMVDAWMKTFTEGGRAPATGTLRRLPDHGDTLEAIAESGGAAFYRGALAEKIDAASRSGGGDLRMADLAAHEAEWVRPISVEYHGWKLHEIPPNGQGIAALIALGILRRFDLASEERDSVRTLHLSIEAMKLAFADVHRHVADPAFMRVSVEALLDEGYLAERAALIDERKAQDFSHGEPKTGGTILLTAADSEGTMISFIQSNYMGFGSGVVVPGTGIALHNRGCNFTLEREHVNEIGPGKRPYHTIIPGFVTKTDGSGREEPVMAFGVMGGFMQPQGHIQVMMRMKDHGLNPQSALDGPRWQVEKGMRVLMEPGFGGDVYERLGAMGHDVKVEARRGATFGRGQVILRLEEGYCGGSDLRADGQAVGF